MTHAVIDGKEVLVLWLPSGEFGEFALSGINSATVTTMEGVKVNSTDMQVNTGPNGVTVSYHQSEEAMLVDLPDGSRVVLADRTAAYRLWAPILTNNPLAPANETGKNQPVLPSCHLLIKCSFGPRAILGPIRGA